MVIVMIRRFVRKDREAEFLSIYRSQKPTKNPAFVSETLTKINEDSQLPPGLRGFALSGSDCVTYVNIAKWKSWSAFAQEFDTAKVGFDPEIETAARQRIVLDVIADD